MARQLLLQWGGDPRNAIVLTQRPRAGSLAAQLLEAQQQQVRGVLAWGGGVFAPWPACFHTALQALPLRPAALFLLQCTLPAATSITTLYPHPSSPLLCLCPGGRRGAACGAGGGVPAGAT